MGATARVCLLGALGTLLWNGCSRDTLSQIQVAVRAEPLDFGPVEIGDVHHANLRVFNAGAAVLHLRRVNASPPFASAELNPPLEIPAGQVRDIAVDFSPDAEGPLQQTATIESDADQAQPVTLKGFGAKVLLSLGPTSLDFGAIPLGGSKTLSVMVHNAGNVGAQLRFDGYDAPDGTSFSSAPVHIPANGDAPLPITATATHLGAIESALHVRGCLTCQEQVVGLIAHGVASALDVSPELLNFGTVAVGANLSLPVSLSNAGTAPLNVTNLYLVATGDADFTLPATNPQPPFVLQPGAAPTTVMVNFAPTLASARSGTLRIISDDPATPSYDVVLQGNGDQVQTYVAPQAIDFGTVAVGMMATDNEVTIYNTSSTQTLTVTSANVTAGGLVFSGGFGMNSPVIQPGDHLSVPVMYYPQQPANDVGTLTIVTTDGTVNVSLKGEAVQLAPCTWSAQPPQLDFGTLAPGQIETLAVNLTNSGSNDCVFTSLTLSASTDPSFTLPDGPVASVLLHPGDWTTTRVTFNPSNVGTFAGSIQFFDSNPSSPIGTVPITGASATGCLTLSPEQVNFGSVPGTCPASTQTITATNTCTGNVDISSVTLGAGTNEFSITGGVTSAHTLAPGGAETFTVAYEPTDDSLDLRSFIVTTADGVAHTVGMQGVGVMTPTHTDTFSESSQAKVDVLFIVDNSGSMTDKQDKLAANFQQFLSSALANNVDFRIVVTTTGILPATGGWVQCPGGLSGGDDGHWFPEDNSSPRILTPQTPNLQAAFATNVHVGTCHWLEQGLESAKDGLSQPLVSEVDDPNTPLPNDGNAGFLRSDARLSMVIVGDADDQSPDTLQNYEQFFKDLKGDVPGQFVFSGIVTPDNKASTCPNGESSGDRYMQLARDTGGDVENICDSDWGAPLANIATASLGPVQSFPLSGHPSDPTQITVTVNGQPVTSGWSYDPTSNTVVFTQGSAPPTGSSVQITYPVGC
ncbi:MAG: choice-of-anchor D domain-containing protein [Deltaproteobacteria bacterium]|nr:choice-of-anchor D domain-containing protein [Deltaproteobacteria bacterium]